jgi:hypothetical protein
MNPLEWMGVGFCITFGAGWAVLIFLIIVGKVFKKN